MARSNASTTEAPVKVVKYVGPADVRRITVADWRKSGVEDEGIKAVAWDAQNGKSLPASDFTEKQLEVIAQNPGFEITEG